MAGRYPVRERVKHRWRPSWTWKSKCYCTFKREEYFHLKDSTIGLDDRKRKKVHALGGEISLSLDRANDSILDQLILFHKDSIYVEAKFRAGKWTPPRSILTINEVWFLPQYIVLCIWVIPKSMGKQYGSGGCTPSSSLDIQVSLADYGTVPE